MNKYAVIVLYSQRECSAEIYIMSIRLDETIAHSVSTQIK